MYSIAIIYDVKHPLIEKIVEFLRERSLIGEWVHWSEITWNGGFHSLESFDAIYLDRMGEMSRSYSTQLQMLQSLEKQGYPIVNRPSAYWIARNKVLTALRFQELNLPTPRTFTAYTLQQVVEYSQQGNFIAKAILGCCAEDVFAFSSDEIPSAEISRILSRDGMILIQEFIPNPQRFIWRVDIVDGQIVVANQRFAYQPTGLPICNGTQGGEVRFVSPKNVPFNVAKMAKVAVSELGLSVAGVDLICTPAEEVFVLEVNPEPDITLDHYEFPEAIANHLHQVALSKSLSLMKEISL